MKKINKMEKFKKCPVCEHVAYWYQNKKKYKCNKCGFEHNINNISNDNAGDKKPHSV